MRRAPVGVPFELEVDGLTIEVTRKRVKNVNFRVGADGVARMSVPPHLSNERVRELAQSRVDWFANHLGRVQAQPRRRPRDWETGESVWVWGEERHLVVERAQDGFGCSLGEGELRLRVPEGSTREGRALLAERWYACQLKERLRELLPVCEERVGCKATSITLRRMKTRWGSCTTRTGTIRINTALAECPPACLEMVVTHELCHLVEPSHNRRFHALMDLHFPGWRASQKWLDMHPPTR
ncbi:MAG: SprT family zinc-dependent metalloprotease [Coriobacteriales bacterium]|nr:SprT family zinc-dependent metalloprotease [Coriobacteriales bacterium]